MIVVSAPFGNHLRFLGTLPTLGTFTLHPRGGLLRRLWRCLLTLRPRPSLGGWTNRLGLPNPGIARWVNRCQQNPRGHIVSVHGFGKEEWEDLARVVRNYSEESAGGWVGAVELNLSCPNVSRKSALALYHDVVPAVRLLLGAGIRVIAKLPPARWMDLATPLFWDRVDWFHCCNTIPTPAGGLSGKVLQQYSLWAVEEVRKLNHLITITGGGGVTSSDDVRRFKDAGANHVAIGSMLLNPFRWQTVRQLVKTDIS